MKCSEDVDRVQMMPEMLPGVHPFRGYCRKMAGAVASAGRRPEDMEPGKVAADVQEMRRVSGPGVSGNAADAAGDALPEMLPALPVF